MQLMPDDAERVMHLRGMLRAQAEAVGGIEGETTGYELRTIALTRLAAPIAKIARMTAG